MKALSIHIGLDRVDPTQYHGWSGTLRACEADARAMAALARAEGIFPQAVLLSADATHQRIMTELRAAATIVQPGDYLVVTFSGHGASYEDIPMPAIAASPAAAVGDNQGDEDDGRDEAWCVYDTYLLDDELHDYFCTLPSGVRVCVVSDSCFSGTVTRDGPENESGPAPRDTLVRRDEPPVEHERRMDPRLAAALYRDRFTTTYQPRSAAVAPSQGRTPGAHVILLAACQDDQAALEGDRHGLFTEHLLATWAGGRYQGSHGEFIAELRRTMPKHQKPNLYITGARDPAFEAARPFTPAPR